MDEKTSWDWHTDLKEIPFKEWEAKFNWVQSPIVSADGECVAAIANSDEMVFNVCVNGRVWEEEYEKVWCLTPVSDHGFAAFVASDEEWTVVVDGEPWSSRCDFLWDMMISSDGKTLAAAFQSDSEYGVIVNDVPWEVQYESMSGAVLASDGSSAAVVQVESIAAADVDAFKKGLFCVAHNGKVQDKRFLNIWDISFDSSAKHIAYGVRLDRESYSIVQDDTIWDNRFQSVWQAEFLDENALIAPVRLNGKWYLFKNNEPFWDTAYNQLWHPAVSQAGEVAAIVSTPFGRWSVAVNDKIWNLSWDTMISDIFFSQDGSSLAAVYKHKGFWDLAVNRKPWLLCADQVFFSKMSPDGSVVAVVAEKKGQYQLFVNGKILASGFSFMADPVISPDGSKVMLKGIKNGIYKRQIISL